MIDKKKIVANARAIVAQMWPHTNLQGTCLYATVALLKSLYAETGIKAQIQAGSMSWRAIDPELDDGDITHFSFIWSPNELASRVTMMQGQLPEIHIWAAIIETQEIIDINTCYLEGFFQNWCTGKVWSAAKPPDFLWCNVKELPDCIYEANEEATGYVYSVLGKLHKEGRI